MKQIALNHKMDLDFSPPSFGLTVGSK